MPAKAAAKFTAVVVLPTPPFWFNIAILRIFNSAFLKTIPVKRVPITTPFIFENPKDGKLACQNHYNRHILTN
jgi:hypothetical protein